MQFLAVVPIFMSAGAAVMPTIFAALASVVAILFKPRELWRLCRQRPRVTALTISGLILLVLLLTSWKNSSLALRAAAAPARPHYDWARIAGDILAQQSAGKIPTEIVTGSSASAPLIEGRGASRTSYAGGPSPSGLKPLWTFHPEDTMFIASPAALGKRIFAAGCQSDLGAYTGLLACLDADTGKPLWQINQSGEDFLKPFFSSPAITKDGKNLIIGQGLHEDRNCALLCFDTATGKLRWAVKTPLHIESSPAIFGDLAVVGEGAIEGRDGMPTGDPGYVFAVRISDGKEMWRQPVNDPESSPAIDDSGRIYIGSGFNGSAVVALRSDPDEVLQQKNLPRLIWHTPAPQPVTSSITLAGDLVIAGCGNSDLVHSHESAQGFVLGLDRKTGQIRWQTQFEDAVLGGVAARDGLLICPVRTGEVAALSQADGHILWRTRISGTAPVLASCGFTGEKIYAVSGDGYLALLDPKTGKVEEKIYLNDQGKPGTGLAMSAPQIIDGRIIVGSETGGLRCLIGSDTKGGAP